MPPGRQTRVSSRARPRGGARTSPRRRTAPSNSPSVYGRCSASASCQSTSTPRRAASTRPASKSSGVRSLATTLAPVAAAGIAALPLPAATSSTRWPGPTPLARTRASPRSGMISVATAGSRPAPTWHGAWPSGPGRRPAPPGCSVISVLLDPREGALVFDGRNGGPRFLVRDLYRHIRGRVRAGSSGAFASGCAGRAALPCRAWARPTTSSVRSRRRWSCSTSGGPCSSSASW